MYRLSKHCDVPIAGMLLIVSTLIIVAVASLLFRRYKKKQDRIKQKLRLDLHRQKQLVKTKQTDIIFDRYDICPLIDHSLDSCKPKLYIANNRCMETLAKEVKLQEKSQVVRTVKSGEVHFTIAGRCDQKLFPLPHLNKIIKAKSSRRIRYAKERAGSQAMKELFKDTEIKFLMRTIYNVQ